MMRGGRGTSFPVGQTCFTKGRHSKFPIIPTKTDENITKVKKDKVILNKRKSRSPTPINIGTGNGIKGMMHEY